MIKLLRKEAIVITSFYKLMNLSKEDITKYIIYVKAENGLEDNIEQPKLNYHAPPGSSVPLEPKQL